MEPRGFDRQNTIPARSLAVAFRIAGLLLLVGYALTGARLGAVAFTFLVGLDHQHRIIVNCGEDSMCVRLTHDCANCAKHAHSWPVALIFGNPTGNADHVAHIAGHGAGLMEEGTGLSLAVEPLAEVPSFPEPPDFSFSEIPAVHILPAVGPPVERFLPLLI